MEEEEESQTMIAYLISFSATLTSRTTMMVQAVVPRLLTRMFKVVVAVLLLVDQG